MPEARGITSCCSCAHDLLAPDIHFGLIKRYEILIDIDRLQQFFPVMILLQRVVPISCNFSRIHFTKENFPEQFEAVMDKYRIPKEYIEVEIGSHYSARTSGQV